MKAKTKIILVGGDEIKVQESLDEMTMIWTQMHRSQPGSVYGVKRVTDHGTVKRAQILAGTIFRLEEA